ncbi:MAG: hypothetical protein H7843_06475 [Nitrospirota bacterium]
MLSTVNLPHKAAKDMPVLNEGKHVLNALNKGNVVIVILLLLSLIYVLMSLPLHVGDSDIWYHLSGGRYFFSHGSPANSSYFSFIQPERLRSNYYWLFQIIVYKIYSYMGEWGLVVFRALMYILILSLILLFLYKRQEKNIYYLTFIMIVYGVALMDRQSVIRPHIFSYILIVAFIYILEFYPRKTFVLPVLALLWSNVHGIEYPVMVLILLAYALEDLFKRIWPDAGRNEKNTILIISVVISAAMIFITPNGLGLVKAPFISTGLASLYIKELRQPSFSEIIPLSLSPLSHGTAMFMNILQLTALLSCFQSIFKRKIRISHAVMFIGGAYLLLQSKRFVFEFVLLALPCVAVGGPSGDFFTAAGKGNLRKVSCLIVNIILLVTALFALHTTLLDLKRKSVAMPYGITRFLAGLDAGGTIANHPNNGGFLQWRLYPKYKILMDMEVPHLFTDYDFYTASNVFKETVIFSDIIDKYNPAFLSVSINNQDFSVYIKTNPNFAVIFFDDSDVLYVNKTIYPEIAARYELKEINPFALRAELMDLVIVDKSDDYIREAKRVFDIYPSLLISQSLARVYNKKEQYEQSLFYTDTAVKNYPEIPAAYNIKADVLARLHRYKEAAKLLEVSLCKADDIEKKETYRQLYRCYLKMSEEKKAYDAIRKSVDVFSPTSTYEDIYNLAALSLKYGNTPDTTALLKIALLKTPKDKANLRTMIENTLESLQK